MNLTHVINICKSINVVHYINKLNENHTIISIDAEKAFDKIQHLLTKKIHKVGIEGTFLNIMKVICDKLTANIICKGEKLKAHPEIINKNDHFKAT